MQQTVNKKELADLINASGVPVPDAALEPLALYLEMLCRWNTAMNLVGAHSWREAWKRLAVDSFHLADFLESLPLPHAPLCWDLGAGAGLPGIPLRMAFTRGDYHMVEAREKRALFLSSVLYRLQLPATHVFHGRVEQFFKRQGQPADCVLSRAFMPWPELLGLVRSRLHAHGLVIIMALEPAPRHLPDGWQMAGSRSYTADGDRRWLWALTPLSPPAGANAGHGA